MIYDNPAFVCEMWKSVFSSTFEKLLQQEPISPGATIEQFGDHGERMARQAIAVADGCRKVFAEESSRLDEIRRERVQKLLDKLSKSRFYQKTDTSKEVWVCDHVEGSKLVMRREADEPGTWPEGAYAIEVLHGGEVWMGPYGLIEESAAP